MKSNGSSLKMNSLISIIIPAHNEQDYIKKTLESIKTSSFEDYEIIVVCDKCEDQTEEIAKEFTKKVFSSNFLTPGQVRNFGAKKARGKILVFNDADTIISKNYLKEIKKTVEEGANYGTARWVKETGHWFGSYWARGNNRTNKRYRTIAGNSFVTKEAFDEVNGFNENLMKGEDSDLGDRLKNRGYKFSFIENEYYIPSERKFQDGFLKFWMRALFESWLYALNKKRYMERFSIKET